MRTKAKIIDIGRDFRTHRTRLTLEVSRPPEELEPFTEKELSVDIKQARAHRSLDANALFWACVRDLAAALGADNWEVYLALLRSYGVFTELTIRADALPRMRREWRELVELDHTTTPDGEEMVHVLAFYGSSSYDSAEMSRLIDGTISDMQALDIAPPMRKDIEDALKKMRKKEQKEKENEAT